MILMLILTYRRLISSLVISGLKELKILKPTSFKSLMKLNGRKSIFSMARKNKFVSGMGDECNESSGRGR